MSRSGPRKTRRTTLVFRLTKPGLVEFVVQQVAPVCRRVARFRVAGRPGVNRVRLRARIAQHPLAPGAYRIIARTLPAGRHVMTTSLVVVPRPNPGEIASLREANVCSSAAATTGSSSGLGPTAAGTEPKRAGAAGHSKTKSKSDGRGVLGTHFTKKAIETVTHVPPWLFALLLVAIALLVVAALPLRAAPNGRAAAILARRRGAIALAGAAAFVATTVAYALLV